VSCDGLRATLLPTWNSEKLQQIQGGQQIGFGTNLLASLNLLEVLIELAPSRFECGLK